VLPDAVERAVRRYLSQADRLLPRRVVGFYVVGSVALGAFREGRSDIDFVAVVDADLDASALRRLRVQHARIGMYTIATAVRHRRSPLTSMCNGVFIRAADMPRPVSDIVPVAAHIGHLFKVRQGGSDVSPVGWKVLAERGITVRGPEPTELSLNPQPELLERWNRENLEGYWRPWAKEAQRAPFASFRMRPRWSTAWGVLGAPRLHHTIATGDVISKEAAGEYALDVFDPAGIRSSTRRSHMCGWNRAACRCRPTSGAALPPSSYSR
jgi:hypothetical protein